MSLNGRGRSFGSGLAPLLVCCALWLGACVDVGPGPAGEPLEDFRVPEVTRDGGFRSISHHGPEQRLLVYPELPDEGARLLFMEGRGATTLDGGRSAWPDFEGARVVVFDGRGVVEDVLQGTAPDGTRLEQPAFVAWWEDGLLAVEPDGNGLLFRDGEPVRWIEPEQEAPVSGARDGMVAARTVFDIPLRPLADGAPLLWRHRDGEFRPVGRVRTARVALLGSLANSGWAAGGPGGETYFASAVRPEIHRYADDGSLEWIAEWPAHLDVVTPRFHHDGSGLSPLFTLVQQSLALGPDGRLYVLAPGRPSEERDHVLVFEEDGSFLRAGRVSRGAAIYADNRGRVYMINPTEALSRTEASVRADFPDFDLPVLTTESEGTISLAGLEGNVVVVNFWASWCAPCRREMPLLDELHRKLAGRPVTFVGVNEDVAPSDGIAFLDEIGGVTYPVVEGGGRQKQRYRYRGLPYTVVLDADGRIVRAFYGFGSSIAPIERAVRRELDRLEETEALRNTRDTPGGRGGTRAPAVDIDGS